LSILSRGGTFIVAANLEEQLESMRRGHVGRLLLRAHRDFSARAITKIRERGYTGLSIAHIAILPHLDDLGVRVSTLAERAGMTKQGMGQLVLDIERQGYVERVLDPSDGRAALIRFTSQGIKLLTDAVAVTQAVESEYAEILGSAGLADFKDALTKLVER
jgi:DNA-binding MarR family transcriptional regulator